jgi:DNA-binding transcriptional ArsR family regulator
MQIKTEVKFSPVYELINSLDFFLKTLYKKSDLEKKWIQSVKQQLSPSLFKELFLEENLNNLTLFKALLFCQDDSFDDTEELVNWFKQLDKKWLESFLKDSIEACKEVPQSFYNFHKILTNWDSEYFKNVDRDIFASLNKEASYVNKELEISNDIDVIENVTNGIRLTEFEELKRVILVPQYHGHSINLYSQFRTLHIYCFPSRIIQDPDEHITQSMKALSDKNRLKILRYIWCQERTFNDILNFTKLARSTVHYHLVLLRSAGLIRILTSPVQSDRFIVRKEGLEKNHFYLLEYLSKS